MIPTGVKVFLASEPVDFRKGPDGDVSVPAAQDTLLEPGDMLEITIDLSRLAIQPSALMASQ